MNERIKKLESEMEQSNDTKENKERVMSLERYGEERYT